MKKGRNGNTRAKWQMGELGKGEMGINPAADVIPANFRRRRIIKIC
jgi:hypothetical protein